MPRVYKRKTDKIQLDDNQIGFIEFNWDKMDIKTLAQKTFKRDDIDGHSAEAKKIKEYIVARFGPRAKINTTAAKKSEAFYGLSEEQREFLRNNAGRSSIEESVRLLFPEKYKGNKKVEITDAEYTAVYGYVKAMSPDLISKEEQIVEDSEYKPPGSIARMVPRINLYVTKGKTEENKRFLDPASLSSSERRSVESLIGYMATYRFVMLMNEYNKKIDRELAESSFVRWCYGKDDLQEEDVDRYISLVEEVVDSAKMRRALEKIENQANSIADGTDAEGKKLSMTLIEMMNTLRDKIKMSKDRQEKLTQALVETRSKRQEKKSANSASVSHLLEAFQDEKRRLQIVKIAEEQKAREVEETDALISMDSVVALIAGHSSERAKNA